MKINHQTGEVIFNPDERQLAKLELSLLLTDADLDLLFDQWVDALAEKAARSAGNDVYSPHRFTAHRRDNILDDPVDFDSIRRHAHLEFPYRKEQNDRLVQALYRWAEKPNGVPHRLIKSFFDTASDHEGHLYSYRNKMRESFEYHNPDRQGTPSFFANFRLMCSNAQRAYGKVFFYSPEDDMVTINPRIEELLRAIASVVQEDDGYNQNDSDPRETLQHYLKQFSSICWYGASGDDYRGLMILSKANRPLMERKFDFFMNPVPDCFIFTDYYSFPETEYAFRRLANHVGQSNIVLYEDNRTSVVANNINELHPLSIPFYPDLVAFEQVPEYGRVFTADVSIQSKTLGKINTRLVYCAAENTAFAMDFLIPNHIFISHVVHVRYGHGFGGGRSTGMYVKRILNMLGTKYFISDYNGDSDHDCALQRYPILRRFGDVSLKPIISRKTGGNVMVPSKEWSHGGDTLWYLVEDADY